MKVNTEEFKKLISKALKGASCNTFSPITCFCGIKETEDSVFLSTTDGINFLTVKGSVEKDMPRPKLDCVVDIKALYAIISKITAKSTTLYTANNVLLVSANGKYSMNMPLDENDRLVHFPEVKVKDVSVNSYTIYADYIRDIIKTNKSALPKGDALADLNGYMFDKNCITTDSLIICANHTETFKSKIMLSQQVMDVLASFEDCIDVTNIDNDMFKFEDEVTTYYAYREDDSNFPLDAVKNLLSTSFSHSVELSRDNLYDALDRIKLFVSPYDSNACYIKFNTNEVKVENNVGTSEESIEVENDVECSIKVNIDFLMSQLKTMQDTIIISFGDDRCIGIKDELTTKIIATMR